MTYNALHANVSIGILTIKLFDMKNVYIASVNPMLFSHLDTYNEAQKKLNEKIFLCIGRDSLKSEGLFSLEERADIAHNFYGIPKQDIILLSNEGIIREIIKNSAKIVRGIRSWKDLVELKTLIEYYGVTEDTKKLFPIHVPKEMRDISSSLLIQKIMDDEYKQEDNWIPAGLHSLIKEKLRSQEHP